KISAIEPRRAQPPSPSPIHGTSPGIVSPDIKSGAEVERGHVTLINDSAIIVATVDAHIRTSANDVSPLHKSRASERTLHESTRVSDADNDYSTGTHSLNS